MKKLSALILGLTLALALVVAGCTPANNEPADDQTNDPAAQNEEPVKLTVVTTAMTEPYSYYDTEDNLVGSEINLWNEISRRTGYEIEFTVADFEGIISMLDSDMADVGSNCLGWTEERAEKYQLSDPYLYQGMYMCVRSDDDSINSMADLVGKTVACSEDSTAKTIIDNYIEENDLDGQIDFLFTTTGTFMLEVNLGRADVTFSQPVNFYSKMETGEYDLKLVGDPIYEEQAVFLFRDDIDPAIVETINATIAEMREDGFLSELYTEVLGVDLSEPTSIHEEN